MSGGDAAVQTQPQNPRLAVLARRNLLAIHIDGVPVRALIDTGAQVSVMSSHLCRRLRKVLTPAPTAVLRVADGGTPPIIGLCTARVTISGHHTPVLFTVLDNCPHEVILGLDFLSDHSALIDCATSVVQLELPLSPESPPPLTPRLCTVDFVRLPPKPQLMCLFRLFPLSLMVTTSLRQHLMSP